MKLGKASFLLSRFSTFQKNYLFLYSSHLDSLSTKKILELKIIDKEGKNLTPFRRTTAAKINESRSLKKAFNRKRFVILSRYKMMDYFFFSLKMSIEFGSEDLLDHKRVIVTQDLPHLDTVAGVAAFKWLISNTIRMVGVSGILSLLARVKTWKKVGRCLKPCD